MSNRDDDFFDFGDDDNLDEFRNLGNDDDLFGDDDDLFSSTDDDLFRDNANDDPFGGDDDFFNDTGGDDLFADDDRLFSDADTLFVNDGDPFDDEDPFGDEAFADAQEAGGGNRGFLIVAGIFVVILIAGFVLAAGFLTGVISLPGGPGSQTATAFAATSTDIANQNATVFAQQTGTADANAINEAATQTQAAIPTETPTPTDTPTPELDLDGTSTALAQTQIAEQTLAAPPPTIDPNLPLDDQRATVISREATRINNEVLNTQVPATLTALAEEFGSANADEATEEITAEATEDPNAQARRDSSLGAPLIFAQDVLPTNTPLRVAQAGNGTATAVVQTAQANIDVTLTALVADIFLTFPAQATATNTPAADLIGTQVAETLTAQAPEVTDVVPTLEIGSVQQTATALARILQSSPTPQVPTVDGPVTIATATTAVIPGTTPVPGAGGELPQTGLVDDLIAGGPLSIFLMIFTLGGVIVIARGLRKRK